MVDLTGAGVRAQIDPDDGGRIVSLRVGQEELLLTRADDVHDQGRYGAFVMAPWAGRTRHAVFTFDGVAHALPVNAPPHAIHGTTRTRPWRVDDATSSYAQLSCDFGPDWPFAGYVEHLVVLHDDRLELELRIHTKDAAMPAACGWHPWWRRTMPDGTRAELKVHAGAMYRRDSEGITVPELLRPPPPGPWDDCFTELADRPATLRWPGLVEVTIETECPDLVVFDELDEAICTEPQSAPPDALNHHPAVVEPDRPLVARTTWTWQ